MLPVGLLTSALLWIFMHTVIFITNKRVVCIVGIKGKNRGFRKEKELSVPAFGLTVPTKRRSQC